MKQLPHEYFTPAANHCNDWLQKPTPATMSKKPMNKQQLAEFINGCEIGNEVNLEIVKAAKEAGLVIVFGASDDLVEFDGAIREEYGMYGGGELWFTKTGAERTTELTESIEDLSKALGQPIDIPFNMVKVDWDIEVEGVKTSWAFSTDMPHANFQVMEDGEVFCIGMVFSVDDMKPTTPAATPALALVAKELAEQREKHGRTVQFDHEANRQHQLAEAASMLALHEDSYGCMETADIEDKCPIGWNEAIWVKMVRKPYKERLTMAAALLVAELERLDYVEVPQSNDGSNG